LDEILFLISNYSFSLKILAINRYKFFDTPKVGWDPWGPNRDK